MPAEFKCPFCSHAFNLSAIPVADTDTEPKDVEGDGSDDDIAQAAEDNFSPPEPAESGGNNEPPQPKAGRSGVVNPREKAYPMESTAVCVDCGELYESVQGNCPACGSTQWELLLEEDGGKKEGKIDFKTMRPDATKKLNDKDLAGYLSYWFKDIVSNSISALGFEIDEVLNKADISGSAYNETLYPVGFDLVWDRKNLIVAPANVKLLSDGEEADTTYSRRVEAGQGVIRNEKMFTEDVSDALADVIRDLKGEDYVYESRRRSDMVMEAEDAPVGDSELIPDEKADEAPEAPEIEPEAPPAPESRVWEGTLAVAADKLHEFLKRAVGSGASFDGFLKVLTDRGIFTGSDELATINVTSLINFMHEEDSVYQINAPDLDAAIAANF